MIISNTVMIDIGRGKDRRSRVKRVKTNSSGGKEDLGAGAKEKPI